MKFLKRTFFLVLLSVLLTAHILHAQTATGILRGQVTDPSGAAVTKASVILTPSTGSPLTTLSDPQGMYEFKSLAPGQYTLTVVAQGFSLYENPNVLIADQPVRLNVALIIQVEEQKVQVSDTSPTVDVNPASNAGAIVISGKELEALPDDPDELQADLEALAGPSAGPNGGQMYIDGFTAGQLPPKSSIREIRINQNPFSSELRFSPSPAPTNFTAKF
jgi:Carboxypeptidase regulatory-like domain